MSKILEVKAIQVFDSRGIPTVSCKINLSNGISASSIVPSGASTGTKEALELRDNNENKYHGKSVLNAVNNINNIFADVIIGMDPNDQESIDNKLIEIDGTDNKSNMGANAILGVSLSVAHSAAKCNQIPLYEHFSNLYKNITKDSVNFSLPMPMFNILNGGEHADNNLDLQEFMIIPNGANDFVQIMEWSTNTYHNLKKILKLKGYSTAIGDEGGFAPNLESNEEAIQLIIDAIKLSNLEPGKDVSIALDCAASEFYDGTFYCLNGEKKQLSSDDFVEYLEEIVSKYPITSIEDGMDESDIEGWKILSEKLNNKCQLVGDDLFVTNEEILMQGIKNNIANSILIKFNQVGSLTETIKTIHAANKNNYKAVISHRSGESEDTTIADLAVGLGVGQIKTGAPCRSDRVAKYNRLLWIESENNKISVK